jgi:hypothetical protein
MGNGIEVSFRYDGMHLACDDAAIARLYEHICRDVSVAEAIGEASKPGSVRYIRVSQPVDESALKGPRWFKLVPSLLGGCISLIVTIVGIVTIYRWVMRQLG